MPQIQRILPVLALAAMPLLAAKVVVEPKGRQYHAGSAAPGAGQASKADNPFQFHARLEGAETGPVTWDWSVVDVDGRTALADAGQISQDGIYTPPPVSLSKYRMIKIRATARSTGHPSGTVLVTLRPHLALTPLEKVLGKQWRGERVELLADLTPPAGPEDPEERKAEDGSDSDSSASEQDYDSDDDIRVDGLPFVTAYAAQVPWAEPAARQDQWIVAAHEKLYLVSSQGQIRPIPVDVRAHGSIGGRVKRYRPVFSQVAAPPPDGARGAAWACYLWDAVGQRLWRLDAQGRLQEFVDLKLKGAYCAGLAQDRGGTLYLNVMFDRYGKGSVAGAGADEKMADRRGPFQVIFRITADGGVTRLAGGDLAHDREARETFGGALGLALAEDRGCAYMLDGKDNQQVWLRTISLKDGKITGQPLDHFRFNAKDMDGSCWPVYHRGTLLVSRTFPPALYAVDPATGHCQQVYRDALSPKRYGMFRREEGAPPANPSVVPGPCFDKARGVARSKCGSLGMRFKGMFSIGNDGQVAAMVGGKLAVVLLDWHDPHSVLGRATGAGREETKAGAGAGGADAPSGAGAGAMEGKATASSGASVTAPSGSAPRIDRIQPSSGGPGTLVVVSGQDLDRVDQVLLGSQRIPTFLASPLGTSLVFYVPMDAPPAVQAPVILGSPAAAGGSRQWIKSQGTFTVLAGTP